MPVSPAESYLPSRARVLRETTKDGNILTEPSQRGSSGSEILSYALDPDSVAKSNGSLDTNGSSTRTGFDAACQG